MLCWYKGILVMVLLLVKMLIGLIDVILINVRFFVWENICLMSIGICWGKIKLDSCVENWFCSIVICLLMLVICLCSFVFGFLVRVCL